MFELLDLAYLILKMVIATILDAGGRNSTI